MSAIHLIERENLFSRVAGTSEYESGYWALSENEAQALIGGNIFFHEKQLEPSYYGGAIVGFRVQRGEPYDGRIDFRFVPQPECRDVRVAAAVSGGCQTGGAFLRVFFR